MTMMILAASSLALGGCTEVTEYFQGDPSVVSACANMPETLPGENGNPDFPTGFFPCIECNSNTNPEAEFESCGVSLSVRCNAAPGARAVYGIAIGVAVPAFFANPYASVYKGAAAWADVDDDGVPSSGDILICGEQSYGLDAVKHESKCTYALKGNGKKQDQTFEVEVKYDSEKACS